MRGYAVKTFLAILALTVPACCEARAASGRKKAQDAGACPDNAYFLNEMRHAESASAFAAMPAGRERFTDAASPRVLPAFSFSPDDSPPIIDGYVARSDGEVAAMPVRNVNLHRGYHKRRPAEIIEGDAVRLTPREDMPFAMIAPAVDEASPRPPLRTKVILPAPVRGIGDAGNDPAAELLAADADFLPPPLW